MNKIYCFGDGYAANHIWPEWPAIVEALYPEIEHKNFGAVGAGNEFISSAVVEAHQENPTAFFLIQWAPTNRFDKLIQDDSWDNIIDTDKTYHFNRVNLYKQQWWLSSNSQQPSIKNYHEHYVQLEQSKLRLFNTAYLINKLTSTNSLNFSTYNLNFSNIERTKLSFAPWIAISMSDYSNQEKFKNIRGSEVQPSPAVHIAWVEEYILPKLPVQPNKFRLDELKRRIQAENWRPFDPDRAEIWKNISTF